MGLNRKAFLVEKFPHLTFDEMCELKRELEAEKSMITNKTYLLAIALMMAGIEMELVNRGQKC